MPLEASVHLILYSASQHQWTCSLHHQISILGKKLSVDNGKTCKMCPWYVMDNLRSCIPYTSDAKVSCHIVLELQRMVGLDRICVGAGGWTEYIQVYAHLPEGMRRAHRHQVFFSKMPMSLTQTLRILTSEIYGLLYEFDTQYLSIYLCVCLSVSLPV